MGAVVTRRELGGDLALAQGLQFFWILKCAVSGAVGEEDLDVLAIDFGALGLAVGAVRAADVGAFVPGEAEPAEGVEDLLLGRGDEAGAVGVFDAEDELAFALTGEEIVDEADVCRSDVGVAGGGWSDADAYRGRGVWGAVHDGGQASMLAEGEIRGGVGCSSSKNEENRCYLKVYLVQRIRPATAEVFEPKSY